jgi:hypothetical protein
VVVKLNADKSRRGRVRRKVRKHSAEELQDAGLEQQTSDQEVEGPVEVESDKEEPVQAELKNSEAAEPPQSEQPNPAPIDAQTEQVTRPTVIVAEPESGPQAGGKRVAENKEGMFEGLTKMNESVFNFEGVKKAAAWYIETGEKLANQALELQEKATGWAKDTPFAPIFEAQHSFARKFVERSANAVRSIWQIPSVQ